MTKTTNDATITLPLAAAARALVWPLALLETWEVRDALVDALRFAIGTERTSRAVDEIGAIELAFAASLVREDSAENERLASAWATAERANAVAAAFARFLAAPDPSDLLEELARRFGPTCAANFVDGLVVAAEHALAAPAEAGELGPSGEAGGVCGEVRA